jgi:iron complex outermembrane receptor protein
MRSSSIVDLSVRRALKVAALAAGTSACIMLFPGTTFAAAAEIEELEEVVVTARFREENLQSTPLAISAFSEEDLQARSIVNVSDLGATVPNAFIRQQNSNFGPTQTIGMRGIIQTDFTYSFEPAVGIYIDDIYHGTLTGSTMDLLDLDRVEVLRGPQGTLFGINTMGGAVRLISKKPQGDGNGYVDVTYGSRSHIDVKAVGDFSLIEDKLFARVSGISRSQEGYGENLDFTCEMIRRGTPQLAGLGDGLGAGATPTSQPVAVAVGSAADNAFSFPQTIDPRSGGCKLGELGGSKSQGGRLQLRLVANDQLEFNLSGDYSKQQSDPPVETLLTRRQDTAYDNSTIFPRYGIRNDDRFVTGSPYTNYSTFGNILTGVAYEPTTHLTAWGVNGTTDYKISEKMALTVIGGYRTYDTTWSNDSDETPFELQQTNQMQEHRQYQGEARLSGLLLGDSLDWTVGLFYYNSHSRIYNTANFPTFGLKFTTDDLYSTENKSAFAHVNYKLTDKFSVSGGLRYSDEAKTNFFRHIGQFVFPEPLHFGGSHVSFKAGADYQATDNLFVYASVSDGFTSAGVTPRIFTAEQLRALEGEEVINYELGAKVELFEKKLRVNSAIFYLDYKNRLTQVTGSQCNLAGSPDPGPVYFLAGGNCPAGTPRAGMAGLSWFYYAETPGEVKGAETEISYFPIDNLSINVSAGYNQFKGDEKDKTLPTYRDPSSILQPKWSASAGAQYTFQLGDFGRLTPRLDYYFQSYRTNGTIGLPQRDPDDIVPGYGIYNARVTFDPANSDYQVSLAVLNLTDHFYWTQLGTATTRVGAPSTARSGNPGRPREWSIQFRKNFRGP